MNVTTFKENGYPIYCWNKIGVASKNEKGLADANFNLLI